MSFVHLIYAFKSSGPLDTSAKSDLAKAVCDNSHLMSTEQQEQTTPAIADTGNPSTHVVRWIPRVEKRICRCSRMGGALGGCCCRVLAAGSARSPGRSHTGERSIRM